MNNYKLKIDRSELMIYPNLKRVICRFFYTSDERALTLVKLILEMDAEDVKKELAQTLAVFEKRHRDIKDDFTQHFNRVKNLCRRCDIDIENIEKERQLLIGTYFTHEYSIEAAAFFNPSIIIAPDQSGLSDGELRVIMSLRATGEGHISSIEFRYLVLDQLHNITLVPPENLIEQAEIVKDHLYEKKAFQYKLAEMKIEPEAFQSVTDQLEDSFTYTQLRKAIERIRTTSKVPDTGLEEILWLADAHHEMRFSEDTDLTERVIFPASEWDKNGIEDARWVRFEEPDGSIIYYGTYTAYDGVHILPKLIKTVDFINFDIKPLYGIGAQNKNLALFPRKVNGRYVMLSRIDGRNNFIGYSDKLHVWKEPELLMKPAYPWEYMHIGNCGSPVETEDGWLLITHGVGAMRRYCIGAALLDLDNPSKVIGRLSVPLLEPNEEEREGYVPNVVYSCGGLIHNGKLILPYAASDYATTFASVAVKPLLEILKSQPDPAAVTLEDSKRVFANIFSPSIFGKSSSTSTPGRDSGTTLELD